MKNTVKVIIDARMIDNHLHGIARYTYEIIKHISKDESFELMLLVNDISMAKKIFKECTSVEYIEMKAKFLSLQEQIELPKVINKYKKEAIFHTPSFSSSPFIKTKSIMTIHDLNHIRFPQFYSPFHKYYYQYIVKPSAKRAKKLITVSKFSKEELLSWLKCKEEKIQVTYNGIDKAFKEIKDTKELQAVKEKYNLPEKFLLYVGNLKPHKNVETLVKAMKHIKYSDIKLVINGKTNDSLKSVMKEYGVEDKLQFIGYVEDKDLPTLYTLASIFIFPSLYEGFGLPPLEAMACNCPTIVANTSSLPEVVWQGAVLVEPDKPKEISTAVEKILQDEKFRKDLVEKGKMRAEEFTWEELAEETKDIYRKVWEGDF